MNVPAKVFIAGRVAPDALEGSYERAFRSLGATVVTWDIYEVLKRAARLGAAGRVFNRFVPVDAWVARANRELALAAHAAEPDLLLVFGTARVTAGTLAQIRALLPRCRQVLVWPDSLVYCKDHTVAALSAYDLVASFSRAMVEPLRLLGARHPVWVPLAFDPELHPAHEDASASAEFSGCDASFIGNHTPERESLILRLLAAGLRVKVWGPDDWRRAPRDRAAARRYWQGRPLVGFEFSLAVRSAPVSLNPINAVTFPAANMRYFEIPGCGGVALSSPAPEMEGAFPVFTYADEADAVQVVRGLLAQPEKARAAAGEARERVLAAHTYRHRVLSLLELLGNP